MDAPSGLTQRHLQFVAALRSAGLRVSLSEGLDAVAALQRIGWHDRDAVHAAYAATLCKREVQRATFDLIFDVHFPRLVGDGVAAEAAEQAASTAPRAARDGAEALEDLRDRLAQALDAAARGLGDDASDGDDGNSPGGPAMPDALRALATEAVTRFGAMPGRQPGQTAFSAYQALRRVAPGELVDRLVEGLLADSDDAARDDAGARDAAALRRSRLERAVADFTRMTEDDARRRIAEQKSPRHVADVALRPSIDRIAFTAARQQDLDEMRRQIGPLARRLATRLARRRSTAQRGPLDVRRTMRASMSTGGVPVDTRHRPRRPHRVDLVVLCDVSGSVAHFAQFTLLLTYALREHLGRVRAFTFVDRATEVTDLLVPGQDPVQVMERLAQRIQHAALVGRTSYGGALRSFAEQHPDALTPSTTLLVLGDARSNYGDLALDEFAAMTRRVRASWWLNPEHPRHWDSGDSAAGRFAEHVAMVECRNLVQLEEFVRGLL